MALRFIIDGMDELMEEIEKVKTAIEQSNGRFTTVGIHGDDPKNTRPPQAQRGLSTNVAVGTINEFGGWVEHPGGTAYFVEAGRAIFVSNAVAEGRNLPRTLPHRIRIPQRSFVRSTADRNHDVIADLLTEVFIDALDGRGVDVGLARAGSAVGHLMRVTILNRVPPPNAATTVARKGFDFPLIEQRHMLLSISYRVH